MSGGELRNYVQIESIVNAVSASGDYSSGKTWGIVDKVWARIDYSGGAESSGERDSTLGRAKIKIRWRDDISNKMRITFGSKVFDIEDNYDLKGRSKYLTLHTVIADGSPATEAVIIAPTGVSTFTDITGAHDYYSLLTGDMDGANTTYTVSAGKYKTGSLRVNWGGVTQYQIIETDPSAGIFDLEFAPTASTRLMANYEI
jgi:SPP1 family predicted phage head-tail adaptor